MLYRKFINIILIFSFLVAPVVPLAKYFQVSAATYFPTVNVFVSQYVTGNWRWYNAIGNFYDTVGNYVTGRSETYLKFDLSGIPSNAIITSANVQVRKYANGGNGFWARIARLAQDINTSTGAGLNDFKSKAEFYGSDVFVADADLDFQLLQWNIAPLAQAWVNGTYPNYGVAIYSDTTVPNSGASLCSTRTSTWPSCVGRDQD